MPSFGELLSTYMARTGISDSELARTLGVSRQTIFRWKEGQVARPRHREDVLAIARRLRLTDAERDQLLLAAGFAPEAGPVPGPASPERSGPLAGEAEMSAPVPAATRARPASSAGSGTAAAPRRRRALAAVAALGILALGLVLALGPTRRPAPPPVARGGEMLIVVALPSPPPGQPAAGPEVVAALRREFLAGRLNRFRTELWPEPLPDAAAAAAARRRSGASLLLWRASPEDPDLALVRPTSTLTLPLAADRPEASRVAALLALAEALAGGTDAGAARPFRIQALALLPPDAAARATVSTWLAATPTAGSPSPTTGP